jgi:hypothetical protein
MVDTITPKDIVLHHLEYTFEKEAWQPSLLMALDGLNAAHACWRPGPERHSIWQIVRHVTHWKRATLEAWNGAHRLFAGRDATPYFHQVMSADWQDAAGDEAAWRADLAAPRDVAHAIQRKVRSPDLDALLQPFPGEDFPAVLRVMRMATHDIYHAGQVRYLRALQGV